MSSTCRGSARRVDDAYMTPAWCVHRLLEVWSPVKGLLVEPAAGDLGIVKAFPKVIRGSWTCDWWTCDIRELEVDRVDDFLLIEPGEIVGLEWASAVVTNPPYSLAEEFVRHARLLCPRAELVFLLRIAFLASAERLSLWRDIGTPDIYVLPNRPSFTGGGTDSADYAWFRWPVEKRITGSLVVLRDTPRSERRAR